LNSNATGSITIDSNNKLAVLEGEDSHAANDAPRVVSEVFLGAKIDAVHAHHTFGDRRYLAEVSCRYFEESDGLCRESGAAVRAPLDRRSLYRVVLRIELYDVDLCF
jgi:predicted HD phosphohydrolase